MSQDYPSPNAAIRAIIAALDELDPLERAVFELCAVDGLDYPAIAQRLGVGVDEVERLLAAAILAIDRRLDEASRRRNPGGSDAEGRGNRLHRLARWLGSS